ncbi:MAG: RnfABCDGE type electron transport complex subunit A [Oscillospiraceae bacterium]|jgi:electron transport complex protein RnfA|nr:RnfABCDGE type electron transport complex subunit A [Oscillospiraceae bacterium]
MIYSILAVFLAGILTENFVLAKFLGICPFLGVSQKLDKALGMSIAVLFVMVASTAATHPIYTYFLVPMHLEYLQTIVFILVIAALVQFIEIFMKKTMKPLHKALGIYLPLITTNCAVLGITVLVIDKGNTFVEALASAAGSGAGFLAAMVIFAGVRERLESSDIPKFLQGLPITLIAASIVSLSFLGFQGILDGIKGVA